MSRNDTETEWCQISTDFLEAHQEWKDNLIKKSRESFYGAKDETDAARIGVESVYEKQPPMPALLISKKQILTQSSLTASGKGAGKPSKWRLSGDFFGYLKRLEDQNEELQIQLDRAVSQLEKTQVDSIRHQNNQKELKETMNIQMIQLVVEYKKAEREHQVQMMDLADSCHRLQQELAVKCIFIERQKFTEPASTEIPQPSRSSSSIQPTATSVSASKDDKNLNLNRLKTQLVTDQDDENLDRLKAQLVTEQSQTTYFAALYDKTAQELKGKEQEAEQLWAKVYELQEHLKAARDIEIDFHNQSIAIEELRQQLELARTSASISDQASIIEAMLPPTSARLQRTDKNDGWEWTPWVKNVTTKALDVDFNGIMEEFKDLKVHRNAAFKRAKSRGIDIVNQILKELGLSGFNESSNGPLNSLEK